MTMHNDLIEPRVLYVMRLPAYDGRGKGDLYFGSTEKIEPHPEGGWRISDSYEGSGALWTRLLSKRGPLPHFGGKRIVAGPFTSRRAIRRAALELSKRWHVAANPRFANLCPEDGGGTPMNPGTFSRLQAAGVDLSPVPASGSASGMAKSILPPPEPESAGVGLVVLSILWVILKALFFLTVGVAFAMATAFLSPRSGRSFLTYALFSAMSGRPRRRRRRHF